MYYPVSKALAWVANPADVAVVLLVAAVVARRRPGAAAALAVAAAVLSTSFSTPAVADTLQHWIESAAPNTYRPDVRYDAAIVLGGSDERVQGAIPVVRSGRGGHLVYTGRISPAGAAHMRRELQALGIPADEVVIADRARNTRENALESSEVVAERGWHRLLLVTTATHAPRALACFRAVGLDPDVLPVGYERRDRPRPGLRSFVPSRAALDRSQTLLHEVIGIVAYRALGYAA